MIMKIKKKTPYQLQELNKLYLEEKYPSQLAMDDYASTLGLTCKQVRDWFVEKRRREKRENGTLLPLCSVSPKKLSNFNDRNVLGVAVAKQIHKRRLPVQEAYTQSFSRYATARSRDAKKSQINSCLQDLLTPEFILKKVFRKDGPPLGLEFDKIPFREFCSPTDIVDARNSTPACQEDQGPSKRRKVPMQALINDDGSARKSPTKSHGLGKGLMTVWRVTNPNARDLPSIFFSDKEISGLSIASKPSSKKSSRSRKRAPKPVARNGRSGNRLKDKRKLFVERVATMSKTVNKKHFPKEKCKLSLNKEIFLEQLNRVALLIDDEELELEELQGGSYSQMHCDHLSTSREHGCLLCKDVLAKFPPNSVKMKKPICMQPWDSSPEIVKKLFKVFHFLYTYATVVDICPFTLDEFVQAFHDKDSMLLGQIHVTLISLLLHDVEVEINNGNLAYLNKSCNFLALIQSLENKEYSLDFWRRSLNSLTWIEILRQVLGAAGFGYKHGTLRREAASKDMDLLVKYGLHPGTLKCTLFKILSEHGNNGSKVSDLAKSMQVVELNLASSTEEVEHLICSTLSSDISLFEKISSSAYRLRMSVISRDADDSLSDTEDAGSVDNGLNDCSTDDECALNSESFHSKISKPKHWQSKNNMLTLQTEIDESHPGEVWLLGLMEGEYSSLSIEEKLNALVALTDILSAGSSIREKDPSKTLTDCNSGTRYCGSGAKIKKSLLKQPSLPGSFKSLIDHIYGVKEAYSSLTSHPYPVDSSLLVSNINRNLLSLSNELQAKKADSLDDSLDAHPMQSVFLGSDRRYNRYWLFLGPCDVDDPGHRRIYFESSEDGHWEVIDTEEGLCTLLSVLDGRGKREALLIDSLGKRQEYLCQAMSRTLVNGAGHVTPYNWPEVDLVTDDSYSPVSDVDNLSLSEIVKDSLPSAGAVVLGVGNKGEKQIKSWIRLQAFDSGIWSSFYLNLNVVKYGRRSYLDSFARCESCHDLYWRDEKHCRICHTTFELDFGLEERYAIHAATCKDKDGNTFPKHKVLSSQTQSLKAAIYAIESVMPDDALVGAWRKSAHKLWVRRLRRTSSLVELLQVLADFVGAINEDWLYRCNFPHRVVQEVIVSFTSMPHTTSALALWLVKLDTIVAPYLEKTHG